MFDRSVSRVLQFCGSMFGFVQSPSHRRGLGIANTERRTPHVEPNLNLTRTRNLEAGTFERQYSRMSSHEEDVLARRYDARLMRRLLTYLRPYGPRSRWRSPPSSGTRCSSSAPPYLTKLVIDRYIPARDLFGPRYPRRLLLPHARRLVRARVPADLDDADDRAAIMFDLRMQLYRHLHRLDLRFYRPQSVGRLMTRRDHEVDVLNELFTSGACRSSGDVCHAGRHSWAC